MAEDALKASPNERTLAQRVVRLLVRPIFPFLQGLIQSLGFMREAITVEGPYHRQPYLIRMRTSEETTGALIERLMRAGFHSEEIALHEQGQVASLRRLCDTYPDRQFHIRLFSDGEIRGHYEYTPEDRPYSHWQETLFENRNEEFLRFLRT